MKLLYLLFSLMLLSSAYGQETIKIEEISNNIVLGPLANNRDLTFGVKNILEEILQDRGLDLDNNSSKSLKIEILYFDVLKNSTQLSVFGKNTNTTVIAIKAYLIENGKTIKIVEGKGQSQDISTSTLIIDKGGNFSQTGVSIALKKVCDEIITKLKL
jgi:uncharacterized lipoprotein YajG